MKKNATEIAVRRLCENDVDDFRALLEIFADAFDGETADSSKTPGREYLGGLLANSGFIALVGEVDGAIAGGLTGYELPRSDQEASEIYIYDLAVAPSYRRLGIARRLLQEVQQVAKQRGSTAIFVQADPADLPAVALYEGIAERSDVLHFDIPMDDGRPSGTLSSPSTFALYRRPVVQFFSEPCLERHTCGGTGQTGPEHDIAGRM